MALRLLDVDAKFRRIAEQIDGLATEIGRGAAQCSKQFVTPYFDPDTSLVSVVFHVPPQVMARLGIMFGEFIQNLRATLDYLAYTLVEKGGLGTPTPYTKFPIWTTTLNAKGNARKPINIDAGVHPRMLTLVKALQPYHAGQNAKKHPLAVLAKLSNIDKHRTLLAVPVWITNPQTFITFRDDEGMPRAMFGQWHPGVFKNDTVIAQFPISGFDPDRDAEQMNVDTHGRFAVLVEEPDAGVPREPILELALMLHSEVLRTLRIFRRAF